MTYPHNDIQIADLQLIVTMASGTSSNYLESDIDDSGKE